MKFSPDGKHVYLTHDADGEFLQLVSLRHRDRRRGSPFPAISPGMWRVSKSIERPATVAFTINENGLQPTLSCLTTIRARRSTCRKGLVSNVKFSPDGKQLGFTLVESGSLSRCVFV